MPDEPSQADSGSEQAPGPVDLRQEAIAAAREQMDTPPEPQPDADDGTEGGDGSEPEVDWSDKEQREKALTAERETAQAGFDERIANQKRSLLGEFEAERQTLRSQAAAVQGNVLLTELDQLTDTALAERVKTDPKAARAIAQRTSAPDEAQLLQAQQSVAMFQAVTLFEVRPELRAMAEENGEDWKKANDPATGMIFGHIQRTAFDEGKAKAIEEFKDSKDYKTVIEEAEQRGRQAALPDMGSPPPADGSTPSGTPTTTYDDPRQAAVEDARRQTLADGKQPPAIAPGSIRKARQPVSAR